MKICHFKQNLIIVNYLTKKEKIAADVSNLFAFIKMHLE
jgi:hypothetical protein